MNKGTFYNKEKIKQSILVFTALALIVFGYYNFNFLNKENSLEVSSRANEINLGDVELVNSKPVSEDNNEFINGIVPNGEISNLDKNISNNNINNETRLDNIDYNYFEETKIERDRMYSEMIETYQKMIDNENISAEQKAIAMQEISNITETKNGIMISENLIKNKGFDNVVILVNNGKVNIVLNNSKLNQEQISQIQNIIENEFNVKIQDIIISFK